MRGFFRKAVVSTDRFITSPVWALALLVAWGCGPAEEPMYDISGIVSFDGAPVEEGTIMFENPQTMDGFQADLRSGGSYSVSVPAGSYAVVIEPIFVEEQGVSDAGLDYKKVDNIPEKYRSSLSTDLNAEVSGDADLNFEMVPGK